jgi:glycosyltransferase involved in cell wall biosynthesis
MSNILLSICIPTFNRAVVLKKSIESIVLQKEFDQSVELVISDNCSDDDTYKVVELFQKKYPNVRYNRNDENIGAENNIFKVLRFGNGKFLKLANDYSIFKDGSLKLILDIIKQHESDHSVICFSNKRINLTEEIIDCEDFNEFISKVSYVTTWILCFGIWKTEFDLIINGTFKQYDFPHLDLLLRNLKLGFKPVIFNKLFISNQTLPIQGGYNIFKTFIQNYLDLLSQYVGENQILKSTYIKEKRKLLFDFIYPWYCTVVIDKNKSYNFYHVGFKTYLIRYFNIRDIFVFASITLTYRIKRLLIKFLKKVILKINNKRLIDYIKARINNI